MTDAASDKPRRRPRYRGRNPRQFHEKYKELEPEQYPLDVAKVLSAGRTPAGMHRAIMVKKILAVLRPQPGDVAVDCTVGYGGHARELLAAVQPGGQFVGVDVDPIELEKTEGRLRALGSPEGSIITRCVNFAGLAGFLGEVAPEGANVLLADLGVSSMQLDDPTRGFSFKTDGPLDMRMNPRRGRSAAGLLSSLGEMGLGRILEENADLPHAEELGRVIYRAHLANALVTTGALRAILDEVWRRSPGRHTESAEELSRRVFQAIRIAVNDELGALMALLRTLPGCVRSGGRIAILTFHSGEDRRVKLAFKEGLRNGVYASISEDVIRASAEERRENPRSVSAKLRFAVRA